MQKQHFCPLCTPSIHPSLIKKSYFLINHLFAFPKEPSCGSTKKKRKQRSYKQQRPFFPCCTPSIHPSLIKKSDFLINPFFAFPKEPSFVSKKILRNKDFLCKIVIFSIRPFHPHFFVKSLSSDQISFPYI